MVWLARPPDGAVPIVADTVQLTEVRGVYQPAAQFAAPGSVLQLRTADDEADFHASGAARFGSSLKRGEMAQQTLPRTGLVIVRSEDRPWMAPACIRVLDHVYHDITRKDGRFKLPPVAPGEYELILWHPGWGKDGKPVQVRLPVEIGKDKGAVVNWTLGE
jgi:hypothetical protein